MNAGSLAGSTLGKYQIQAEIGRGGMAAVYKGYDAALERHVAVKVLASFLVWQEAPVERFLREARAAAQLGHPNIVTIFDVGEERGCYYYVMEYLEGRTLTEIVRRQGAQPADRTVSILQPLSEALDYAHEKGVVHRDVKSSNVVVGRAGRVTLTDFGIARAAQETRLTATGTAIGTPEYMSPEQAEGLAADARSDQYSLAVVAYEMLSGQLPFQAENTLALLLKVTQEPPPPIRATRPDLAAQVEQVLGSALAKSPGERYPSVRGFVAALESALAIKGPVPLRPVTPTPPPEDTPTVVSRPEDAPAGKVAAVAPAAAPQTRRSLWQRAPGWLWALAGLTLLVLALGGLLVGLSGGRGDRMATPAFTPVVAAESNEGGSVAVAAPATATLRPTGTAVPAAAAETPDGLVATLPASPAPNRTLVPSPQPTHTSAPANTRAPTASLPPSPAPTRTLVPSPQPTRTSALANTRAPTATLSASPAPTRTLVPSPRPTRTPAPTNTPAPTATPSPTPSSSRTPAPTRAVPPTQPPPSPTDKQAAAANRYLAPGLLSPADGEGFSYQDEIVLRWQPVGQLPEDGCYAITLAYAHGGETWYDETPCVNHTQWTMSEHQYLLEMSDDGQFRWAVQAAGPGGAVLSPMSAERTFFWTRKGEPDGPRWAPP